MSDFLKKLKTGLHGTLRFNNGVSVSHMGTVVAVTTNTVIDQFFVGDFSSALYTITVNYASNKQESMQVRVVARPNAASVSIVNRTMIDDEIITLSGTVTASYFQLTASVTNSAYANAKLTFFANYAETANETRVGVNKGTTLNTPNAITGSGNVVFQPTMSNTGFASPNFSVNTSGAITSGAITSGAISAGAVTATSLNITIGTITVNNNPIVVLTTANTLPSSIVNSSLTSIGILTSFEVDYNSNPSLKVTNGQITIRNRSATPGTIDGINIGATAPGTGAFTQLTTTITPTAVNQVTRKDYVDRTAAALAIALGA